MSVGVEPQARPEPAPARASALDAAWLPWAVLAALLVAGGVLVLYFTRGTTLWFDDWVWALNRRSGIHSLLTPYNGHFSLIPVLIYRALFATVGIHSYAAYRIVIAAGHLICVLLVFEYARRRVGAYLALLAAALILFLGPAWQDFLWPFQIAWLISIGSGVAMLLALDRRDRLGDGLACVLLAVSLASSSVGVAVAAGAVVEVAWGRRRWRDGWIVAAPVALYLIWSLAYQHTSIVANDIFAVPRWAASSAAASLSALLGLSGQSVNNTTGTILEFGVPLAVVAVVLMGRAMYRRGIKPRMVSLMTILAAFWVLTAIGRSFIGTPYASRYLYVDCVFVLLLALELLAGVRVRPWAGALLALVTALAVLSNVGVMRDAGGYLRSQAPIARADLAALEIARPIAAPTYVASSFPGYPFVWIRAGPYFAMRKAVGSPAYSIPQLVAAPEPAREVADSELLGLDRLTLQPTGSPALGAGAAPGVDSAVGATVTATGPCVTFRPSGVEAPAGDQLTVTLPGQAASISTQGSAVAAARRFGAAFHQVGQLAPGAHARLSLLADTAPQPWQLQLQTSSPARICGQ